MSGKPFRVIAFPAPKRTAENKPPPFTALQSGGEEAQRIVERIRSNQDLPPGVRATTSPKGAGLSRFLKTFPPAKTDQNQSDLIDVNFGSPWSSERGKELKSIFDKNLLRRNGFLSLTFTMARTAPGPERRSRTLWLEALLVLGLTVKAI